MRTVVIGFLGTKLDAGKRRSWRPSVQICAHPDFPVDRIELLHDARFSRLAGDVAGDIAREPGEPRVVEKLDPVHRKVRMGADLDGRPPAPPLAGVELGAEEAYDDGAHRPILDGGRTP